MQCDQSDYFDATLLSVKFLLLPSILGAKIEWLEPSDALYVFFSDFPFPSNIKGPELYGGIHLF